MGESVIGVRFLPCGPGPISNRTPPIKRYTCTHTPQASHAPNTQRMVGVISKGGQYTPVFITGIVASLPAGEAARSRWETVNKKREFVSLQSPALGLRKNKNKHPPRPSDCVYLPLLTFTVAASHNAARSTAGSHAAPVSSSFIFKAGAVGCVFPWRRPVLCCSAEVERPVLPATLGSEWAGVGGGGATAALMRGVRGRSAGARPTVLSPLPD